MRTYDPIVTALPDEFSAITLSHYLEEVLAGCDAASFKRVRPVRDDRSWFRALLILIAAEAMLSGFVLVSSDDREFARIVNLRVESWRK